MSRMRGALLALAGLLGAAGVAAAAASSHAGAHLLGPLSLIALTHAPALLALALHGGQARLMDIAAAALGGGAALFCADLAARHFLAMGLFPLSAPLGGVLMIGGWALLAVSGVLMARR